MSKKFKPYVGLRPFQDDESLIFFGREKQTLELLQRLHHHNFVAVVGTSGCGKSSLIRAGLIPALKGGYLVEESDGWCIAKMKPGEKPLYNLAQAINKQVQILDPKGPKISHDSLVKKIEEDGVDAIIDLIKPLRKTKHMNFFLLIDQFEELFDFAKKEPRSTNKNEATGLINLMLDLSDQSEIPFYVVMTMRSDFIGDCTEYYRLPEALNESQYLVPRLTRSQLRQVIEGPAKLSQLKVDSALTSKLLNEVGKFHDGLPVLQHALLRMWQNEVSKDRDGEIDFKDYDAIGGLNHALSNDANKAFNSLTSEDQEVAKNIFKSLTTVDESGRKIRHRSSLKDLIKICKTSSLDIYRVIKVFIQNDRSFIIYDSDKGLDQIIDISHESLIRQWDTLEDWVDTESKNVNFYKELVNARKEYENRSRSLLDSVAIKRVKKKFKQFKPNKIWASKIDQDFNATMGFFKKSRRRLRTKRIGAFILLVFSLSLIIFLISNQKNDKLIQERENLLGRLESDMDSLIERSNTDFLESYLRVSAQDGYFIDTIQTVYYLRLFERVKTTNLLKDYEEYLVKATEDTTKNREDTLRYFKEAREIVVYVKDSIKRREGKLTSGEITEEDLAWNRANDYNTFQDYIYYYVNTDFKDQNKKHAALDSLKSNGSHGWVYAGRLSNDGNQIYERIFNIVFRNDAQPNIDAMLQENDVVELRGGTHRYIYEKPISKNKITDAIVKNDIKYFINKIEKQGTAIFVEIYFEKVITQLVRSINNEEKWIRTESLHKLIDGYQNSSAAVDIVLDLFNDRVIDDLTIQGRINGIVFLNNTTNNAWSKESIDRANKLIVKWEERHNSKKAIIGPQTRVKINDLKEKLIKFQSKSKISKK